MNIFFLDYDVKRCAKYHCDQHVIKMITEHNQMLCSNLYILNKISKKEYIEKAQEIKQLFENFPRKDFLNNPHPYKITHQNHPCAIWLRESFSNTIWLIEMTFYLCEQYQKRYGKIHKGEEIIFWLKDKYLEMIDKFPSNDNITEPPQVMPDEYKDFNHVVIAYRNFYKFDKIRFAKWKFSKPPNWL